MRSILVVSKDPVFIKSYIEKLKQILKVSKFNTFQFTPSPSIGIGDARKIKSILTRKTYQGGNRLIVINEIEKATIQAQNALLKILEEPPEKTFCVLTTQSTDQVLPTVVSRCQLVKSKNQYEVEIVEIEQLFKKLINSSPGKRLHLSQEWVNNRKEGLKLSQTMIVYLKYLLVKDKKLSHLSRVKIVESIKKVAAASDFLKNNTNVRLTLDVLFLGLP